MSRLNEFNQRIGPDLDGFSGADPPTAAPLIGRTVTLERFDPDRHVVPLYAAIADEHPSLWTYIPAGPFADATELGAVLNRLNSDPTTALYVIIVDEHPCGFLEYLRIDESMGTIEIGFIIFASTLQRTTPATEALYLLIRTAFALGYRRVEWKCDALNEKSLLAAERLGFTYEGTFRKAAHYKGRSRDTAWFSIIDDDWSRLHHGFLAWLAPENFDESGRQRRSLSDFHAAKPG